MLDEGRRGAASEQRPGQALYRVYARAVADRDRLGELGFGIISWITGGRGDREATDFADEILNGTGEDRRRDKVYEVVHRLATGGITWEEFITVTKKGLIPSGSREAPVPPPDALPLTSAKETLEAMLAEAGVSPDRPSPKAVWSAFVSFARCPFAAKAPHHVENDMCLFQWGVHDWGSGRNFECDLTRQFVVYDEHGDCDHMEQLSMTLLLDADDSDLLELGTGDLWSGDDIANWESEVEALDAFAVIRTKSPSGLRLNHTDV
ncbi:MAG TPA: hypothetical protein VEH55_11810 [Gaiellaceae bacterium]|nr:hypothetical protein [Gaiellaceae bacterium]